MKPSAGRAGFTIVELIVVAVLGSLVVLASHKVLAGSVRAYTVVGARVQTQQATRAGADVLFSELREISPKGGDLLAMGQDSLVIRSMRSFGVACAVNPASWTPTLTVRQVGSALSPGDSVLFFADNQREVASDDVWLRAKIHAVDATATCPSGDAAQVISLLAMAPAMAADTVHPGAPVRAFTHYWYGLYEFGGEWYLGRREVGGDIDPLVGPLAPRASSGLRFAYFDMMGVVTTVPSEVAQIRVTLRSDSPVTTSLGTIVADSLITTVFPRN